ncbi:MAG: arylamine N-acetyltransferase [Bacteroidota bacterium]|nr:arylamine N-acetyltransferase [Bacteroidota bacterium]
MIDLQQYFERIHYVGSANTSLAVLNQLQLAHLMHVPFENLDIQHHIKIDLGNLFNKIVINKRGGFCYELNGLFYQLLKEIGFKATMISARVYNDKTKIYSPEYDHLAITVSLEDGLYLSDVGFGEFALSPVKIEDGKETNDPRGIFKIEKISGNDWVVAKKDDKGQYIPEYKFSGKERYIEEFYPRCLYHQTSPESHFMQKIICSLPTQYGRITLTGNIFKITDGEVITERTLHSGQEVQQVLQDYFFSDAERRIIK